LASAWPAEAATGFCLWPATPSAPAAIHLLARGLCASRDEPLPPRIMLAIETGTLIVADGDEVLIAVQLDAPPGTQPGLGPLPALAGGPLVTCTDHRWLRHYLPGAPFSDATAGDGSRTAPSGLAAAAALVDRRCARQWRAIAGAHAVAAVIGYRTPPPATTTPATLGWLLIADAELTDVTAVARRMVREAARARVMEIAAAIELARGDHPAPSPFGVGPAPLVELYAQTHAAIAEAAACRELDLPAPIALAAIDAALARLATSAGATPAGVALALHLREAREELR
jgi:hypothetical protein